MEGSTMSVDDQQHADESTEDEDEHVMDVDLEHRRAQLSGEVFDGQRYADQ